VTGSASPQCHVPFDFGFMELAPPKIDLRIRAVRVICGQLFNSNL
jgi:hypothetical protein